MSATKTNSKTPVKQPKNRQTAHLTPWQFKKGQSGNPAGRPATKTLKEFARAYLAGMTDEERIEYFEGMDKKTIWEMAEGKAEVKAVLDATIDHKLTIDPKAESLIDEIIGSTN